MLEVQVFKWPVKTCSSSSSLSYSAGPISSSFSAESLAMLHGLEWCHSHLKTCHFQSALILLSTAPVFPNQSPSVGKVPNIPEGLWLEKRWGSRKKGKADWEPVEKGRLKVALFQAMYQLRS